MCQAVRTSISAGRSGMDGRTAEEVDNTFATGVGDEKGRWRYW